MKRTKRSILSLLLAIAVVLSAIPSLAVTAKADVASSKFTIGHSTSCCDGGINFVKLGSTHTYDVEGPQEIPEFSAKFLPSEDGSYTINSQKDESASITFTKAGPCRIYAEVTYSGGMEQINMYITVEDTPDTDISYKDYRITKNVSAGQTVTLEGEVWEIDADHPDGRLVKAADRTFESKVWDPLNAIPGAQMSSDKTSVTFTAPQSGRYEIAFKYGIKVSDSRTSFYQTIYTIDVSENVPEKPSSVKVSKIQITGASKKIAAGRKITLTDAVKPANADNKSLTWSTSNSKYADVSSKGVVTTKSAGGGRTVTITAKAKDGSGVKGTYKISIMKHAVKSVKLSAKTKSVKAGKKLTVKASVKTTGSKANKTLRWSSSNTSYAGVSSKGVVTAHAAGKGQTVTITAKATDGTGKKGTIKIKIK